MKKIIIFIFAQLIVVAQEFQVPAIEFNPEKYVCFRTNDEIIIDGKIDEPAWTKAEWTGEFVDIEGNLKPSPRFSTRVKMLWDDNYFYISAELQEPHVWGTLLNRDDIIYYDNDFEVFIDPDGDTHSYAELEMNALNTIWDLFLIQPYRDIQKAAIHNWDIKGLKTAVHINGTLNNPNDIDTSWTVEIAFPWNCFSEITSVSVPPVNGDQWRVNFSRVEWNTTSEDGGYKKLINLQTGKSYPEDNWVWSPQGLINIHYPEMWGYVQFSDTHSAKADVKFINSSDEQLKWFLRQIYYAEKNYYHKNKKYTSVIDQLEPGLKNIGNVIIEAASDLFQASIKSPESGNIFTINQNGLISIKK